MKSGFHLTTSDEQLSSWTEKKFQSTSQSQTCTRKSSRSLSGGLLPVGSTTAFWIPAKQSYVRNMLSKSMRYLKSTTAAGIGQQNGSNSFPKQSLTIHCTANTSKVEQIRLKVLLYPLYLPDLLPTGYPFFKHLDNFSQVKRFHNQQDAENAFQEFVESWRMDFYTIGIFLISKNVLIVMIPILINKYVFESS